MQRGNSILDFDQRVQLLSSFVLIPNTYIKDMLEMITRPIFDFHICPRKSTLVHICLHESSQVLASPRIQCHIMSLLTEHLL